LSKRKATLREGIGFKAEGGGKMTLASDAVVAVAVPLALPPCPGDMGDKADVIVGSPPATRMLLLRNTSTLVIQQQ
jgi:hypothetical protein